VNPTPQCPACGATLDAGSTPCPRCGSLLAGMRPAAVEPMRQEALFAFRLLESAGMHPILAFHDDSGLPHPIEPEEPFMGGGGLMIPVTTTFAVYVPESEADESESILEDARTSQPDADA
jgi:hypothetical protein